MAKSNGKKSHGVNQSLATAVPRQPAGVGIENEEEQHKRRVKTKGEVKSELQSDPTKDYHYTRYNYFGELFVQNLPIWRLITGRMMLTSDPVVSFSMNIRNAALMAAEITVEAKKPEVGEWVKKQWDFLWNYYRVPMVSAKELGYAPLQINWREDDKGVLNIKSLKEFAPEDCRGKERGGKVVGFSVKGVPLFFPHGLWLSYDAKYGSPYGNPITRRQYPAWYEKWMERGAKRLQQLRMIKDAYIGDVFWYPPDLLLEIPDGHGGKTAVPWKDVLREIAEHRTSGGAMTLPLKLDGNGRELTKYQPPTAIPGATEIFNWVEYCDENILRGGDIPFEVVQAADTGSGFSGRSIPFLVLLSVCNGEFSQIVQQTNERALRPVASLTFGGDPEYEIKPRSLVETFSADISGSSLAGGSIGGPVSGVPQAVTQQYSEDSTKDMKRFYIHTDKGRKITWAKNETHAKRKGERKGFKVRKVTLAPIQFDETKEEKIHEYSCLLFNLPGDLAFEVRQLAEQIPHEDLAEDGRELNPHITIKFGLHTDDTEEVRQAIQDLKPVPIQIGKASIFQGTDKDTGKPTHDVVKLDVESSALHDLNNNVSKRLECTDTHPEYKPHITLAYVKPGLGEYYAKRLNLLEGKVAVFDRAIFSNKRREWNPIKLLGEAQFNEGPEEDEDDWEDDDSDEFDFEHSQHSEHPFESKGNSRLGKLYHGSGEHLTHVDETALQKRDSGYYGRGFYTARSKSAAKTYGRKLTQIHVHPHATVLHSSLHPKDAPELHKEIQEHATKHWRPLAEARGKAHLHDEEMKHVSTSPIAWKEAVDRYARDKHYDIVHHSDGEVVIKNPKIVSLTRLNKKPTTQHSEGEHSLPFPYADWFDEEQFAEGSYLQQLRDLIGKGLEAAKDRVKGLGTYIRGLNALESLQTLTGTIEEQIRKLAPLLGNDLFSDTLPSFAGGTLDVLSRLPSPETPKTPETSPEAPIAPGSTLGAVLTPATMAVRQPPTPVVPALAEILFPEPHEPAVHLPAIETAVEALQKAPVAVGAHYLDTAQKVKQGSFAITGEVTEKAVSDIRDVLAKTIEEGKPQQEFIETVAKRLEEEGSPLSPPHLENIFRTNTMSAYSKAQEEAVAHPMVSDAFPYVLYSATRDARVRPEHWALEEKHGLNGTAIYRYDDPTFKKFRPPWSYNCRCRWTPQTVEQAARKGVKEAMEWLDRAKTIAKVQGGTFHQYLVQTAPVKGEHVEPPPFEPDPAFKRDLVVAV